MEKCTNEFDSVYLVAKKELSDRNSQRQKRYNAPNIPEGTKFYAYWFQVPKFKFIDLVYQHHRYTVNTSDLDIVKIEDKNNCCTYNCVY